MEAVDRKKSHCLLLGMFKAYALLVLNWKINTFKTVHLALYFHSRYEVILNHRFLVFRILK